MKILVTGGAGFIGSHVSEFYAKSGDEVVVLDNLSRGKLLKKSSGDPLHHWKLLKKYKNINLIRADVRNIDAVRAAAKNVDAIVHTAAQVAVTSSVLDPRTDFEINTVGTFNVLDAARRNDADVIFTSTNKVYGDNVNRIPVSRKAKRYEFTGEHRRGIPETMEIDDTHHSPYGSSKLAADILVQEFSHTYGLNNRLLRMSCIYGDRQFGVEDQGWVAWFTIAAIQNKTITIYGDGKQVRDVLYIDDLVRLIDKLLHTRKLRKNVFNVGGGKDNTLSLLELVDLLEGMSHRKIKLRYSDWRPADQKVYISDIARVRSLTGWSPSVSPEAGVKKLYRWADNHFSK